MPRKYQPIWEQIKAVKVGVKLPIRCHESAARTLIQAVKKEKTMEVAQKKSLGMLTTGNLVISQEPDKKKLGFVIIHFSLEWDGTKL